MPTITETLRREYDRARERHPFMPARDVLRMVKHRVSDDWETSYDGTATCERDGFAIALRWVPESTCPMPDKHGETDYGRYVDAQGSDYTEYDPSPCETPPMGLPASHFKWGAYQQERFVPAFFYPNDVAEQYDYMRRCGQSRSVARDLTTQWVERWIRDLLHLEIGVAVITVSRADVELGSTTMGSDYVEPDVSDIIDMVEEYGMVEEAIEEARGTLARLCDK